MGTSREFHCTNSPSLPVRETWSRRVLRASASAPFRTAALTSGTLMIAGDALAQTLERNTKTEEGQPDPGHDVPRSIIMASWGCTVLPLVWAPWYSVLDRAFTRIGPLSRMGRFSSALAKAVLTACTIAPLSNTAFFAYSTSVEYVAEKIEEGSVGLGDVTGLALDDIPDELRAMGAVLCDTFAPQWRSASTAPLLATSAIHRNKADESEVARITDVRITPHTVLDGHSSFGIRGLHLDGAELSTRIQDKVRSEFTGAVVGSFSVWVPANTIAWYAIPPAFRFPILSSLSVLWNTYLSLAQHRPTPTPSP